MRVLVVSRLGGIGCFAVAMGWGARYVSVIVEFWGKVERQKWRGRAGHIICAGDREARVNSVHNGANLGRFGRRKVRFEIFLYFVGSCGLGR